MKTQRKEVTNMNSQSSDPGDLSEVSVPEGSKTDQK